jgi:DNA invertase Pin-like site-specific DNA recombinase
MNTIRCAIYTRKSTDEGLEQDFNSLHAQREACEAYVRSQASEGWIANVRSYDDGGYSGGSTNRPGLQRLLTDIHRGEVDIVVVYKVDRLTRSLSDFAKIVDLFDRHKVSFVSVTQAFNTTTSMGRLTLNMLLSFSQFEREITAERIRDKIAASKAKGLWMGGRPPLGYDGVGRKLVINAEEADLVRYIFRRYLELGSVLKLTAELRAQDVRSKRWTNKQGVEAGGASFSRGALYHLLANPVYRGIIRHRELLYENSHPAIVDEAKWSAVRAKLNANVPELPSTPRLAAATLLRGILFDDRGHPMRTVHCTRRAQRYRYYVSTAALHKEGEIAGTLARIGVGALDDLVLEHAAAALSPNWRPSQSIEDRVRSALLRVTLSQSHVAIILRANAAGADKKLERAKEIEDGVELNIAIRLKHRQTAILIETPGSSAQRAARVDRALLRALCLARAWAGLLASGEVASVRDLALRYGFCNHYAAKLLPLAWLAPDLAAAIIDGEQPKTLTLGALVKRPMPMDWNEQRALFATYR